MLLFTRAAGSGLQLAFFASQVPIVTLEALAWRPLRARAPAADRALAAAPRLGAWAGWALTNAVLLPFAPLFVESLRRAGVFDDMLEAFPAILM